MAAPTALPEDLAVVEEAGVAPADLSRDGTGYTVHVYYLPSLQEPESAYVLILGGDGQRKIDEIIVDNYEQAMDAFRHPSAYSHELTEFLNRR